MAEELIRSYIDREAFEADTNFVKKQLDALEAQFKKLRDTRLNLQKSSSAKETADEIKRARVETEALRQKNLELAAAIKAQRLEAAKAALEKKKAAEAEKIRIEQEKQARKEAQAAEIEKNRALLEQKKRQLELEEVEERRRQAEKEHLQIGQHDIPENSGQSGRGKIVRPDSAPFVPETERESSILYLAQLEAGLKANKLAQKELNDELKTGQITQSQYDQAIVKAKLSEEEYRVLIKQTTAEVRARAAAENAVRGTIDAARAQNALLTKERDQIPVGEFAHPDDIARVRELNAEIDKNNDLIQQNVDLLAQQKINIGNYPTMFGSAFKTLNKELENVQSKISSGNFEGKELDQLRLQMEALERATGLTGKEFSSSTAEANAYREAAVQIGQVYGKNSSIFKTFSSQVRDGAMAQAELAKHTASAGSSARGLMRLLPGLYTGLKRISYVIPGLGIAGLISMLVIPLQSFGASLMKLFRRINEQKLAVQTLNDVNLKAVEIFSKQKTEVVALTEITKNQALSLETRENSLKKLIALNPEYLRGLTLENINTDEGRLILDKYNLSLQKKAELQAAQIVNQNSNQIVANLEAEKNALIELSKQGKVQFNDLSETQQKFLGNFNTFVANFKFTASLLNTAISKKDIQTILKGIDEEIKNESVKVNASLKIYTKKFAENLMSEGDGVKGIIQKLQDEISDLQKIQPTLLTESDIRANVAKIKALQDELNRLLGTGRVHQESENLLSQYRAKNLKSMSEYSIENLKILQDMYKEMLDDQSASEASRLHSLEQYNNVSLELIKKQRKAEEDELTNEVTSAKKQAEKISNAQVRADTIVEIERYQTNQLKLIKQKYDRDVKQLDNSTWEARMKISQESWEKIVKDAQVAAERLTKHQEEAHKNVLRESEIFKYDQLMALQEDYQTGSIKSIEEYNQRRQDIEDAAAEREKRAEMERLQAQEALTFALFGFHNLETLKQIKALEFEIADIGNKKILASDLALFEAQKELMTQKREAFKQALDSMSDIFGSQMEALNQADEARFKKQEENAERERELIEGSTLSQEEKEQRIKQINERIDAQQAAMDAKQRERAVRQAQFDKAMSVLNIGIKTSETIFGLIAKAALAPLPAKPTILAQIPWVSAMSALEIGAILAKPLPRFKHGKTNSYQGPAIVGDGGVSEYIVRQDGSIEKTPIRDTLTYVGRDDVIFPNLAALLKTMAMPSMRDAPTVTNDDVKQEIQSLKPYLSTIARKREVRLGASSAGMQALWKWGSRQVKYVHQNTNW